MSAASPKLMLQPAFQMAEVTVELKVFPDCNKCLKKVRDKIMKMDGVFFVNVDEKNNKVTVKGHHISGEKICCKLCSKLGIYAEILPPAKKTPEKEKEKEKEKGGGGGKPDAKPKSDAKPQKEKGECRDIKICVINNFYYPHPNMFGDRNPEKYFSLM